MGKSKELKIGGRRVMVTTETPERGPHIVIRAECEGEIVEHSMTVGPAEGAGRETYDAASLQRDLDAAREKIAERAAWQAKVRELVKGGV